MKVQRMKTETVGCFVRCVRQYARFRSTVLLSVGQHPRPTPRMAGGRDRSTDGTTGTDRTDRPSDGRPAGWTHRPMRACPSGPARPTRANDEHPRTHRRTDTHRTARATPSCRLRARYAFVHSFIASVRCAGGRHGMQCRHRRTHDLATRALLDSLRSATKVEFFARHDNTRPPALVRIVSYRFVYLPGFDQFVKHRPSIYNEPACVTIRTSRRRYEYVRTRLYDDVYDTSVRTYVRRSVRSLGPSVAVRSFSQSLAGTTERRTSCVRACACRACCVRARYVT